MKKRRNINRQNLITGIAVSICLGFMFNTGDKIESIKVEQKEKIEELQEDVDLLREHVLDLESEMSAMKMKIIESEDLMGQAIAPLAEKRKELTLFFSNAIKLVGNFQKAADFLSDELRDQESTLGGDLQMIESTLHSALESLNSIVD